MCEDCGLGKLRLDIAWLSPQTVELSQGFVKIGNRMSFSENALVEGFHIHATASGRVECVGDGSWLQLDLVLLPHIAQTRENFWESFLNLSRVHGLDSAE